jgi:hypothetical protein
MSGPDACAILARHGFVEGRRRSSHIVMQRQAVTGTTTVPVPRPSGAEDRHVALDHSSVRPASDGVRVVIVSGLETRGVCSVNTGQSKNQFSIKYVFEEWGRYRLDLGQMAYLSDPTDPDARARNDAIHRAFQQAGQALVRSNPAIQTWSHLP